MPKASTARISTCIVCVCVCYCMHICFHYAIVGILQEIWENMSCVLCVCALIPQLSLWLHILHSAIPVFSLATLKRNFHTTCTWSYDIFPLWNSVNLVSPVALFTFGSTARQWCHSVGLTLVCVFASINRHFLTFIIVYVQYDEAYSWTPFSSLL